MPTRIIRRDGNKLKEDKKEKTMEIMKIMKIMKIMASESEHPKRHFFIWMKFPIKLIIYNNHKHTNAISTFLSHKQEIALSGTAPAARPIQSIPFHRSHIV
jgi:hypothetical protein